MNIPDSYDMWQAHEQELERLREMLPICEECGEPIQDEYLYIIDDRFICEECLNREYRKRTEVFIHE